MKRMKGPRFFPSGRRFGPYFSRRLDASVALRPFSVPVASAFTTSSTGIAYQDTTSLAVSAFAGAVMIGLPVSCLRSVAVTKSADVMHGPEVGTKYRVKLTGLNLRGVLDRGPTSPQSTYRAGRAFRKISMAIAPMNKAITSTGGTKPFLRENRHQSTHPAMVRMVVPAYRETV